MLKAYQRCSLRTKKHLAIARQLRHLSKNHQSSLKKITASKFYSVPNDQASKFSQVMYGKDKNLHIVNSKMIENLNTGYNPYTQIENACNKINDQFAAGTFYLNNNYPAINCTNNLTKQNQSFKVQSFKVKSNAISPKYPKNSLPSKFNGGKTFTFFTFFQNKKQFKDNNLVSKFFA